MGFVKEGAARHALSFQTAQTPRTGHRWVYATIGLMHDVGLAAREEHGSQMNLGLRSQAEAIAQH